MNHNEITILLGQFYNGELPVERYNVLSNFAQNKHYADLLEVEPHDLVSLRPFIQNMGTDLDTPPLYVGQNGSATLPPDYEMYDALTVFNNGKEEKVEVVDQQEFDCRRTQTVEVPTQEYPVCNFQGGVALFLPKSVRYVNMRYFRRPTPVEMTLTTASGYAKYDPVNSVEFEWDTHNQVKIILIMLQELGIQATQEQVESKTKN